MVNDWAVPPMSTFNVKCAGHEGAGVVVKVGENVKGWKVGDRGGVKPLWDVCNNCELCWDGKENYCQKAVYTGLAATGKSCQSEEKTSELIGSRNVSAVHRQPSKIHLPDP